jgi:hypothetical protein
LGLQASVLQLVLFGKFVYEHVPVLGLHVPGVVWHSGGVLQLTGDAPVHTPDWQVSTVVQALASLQDVPSSTGAQAPVADEHVLHPEHEFPVFCQTPVASQVWG